MPYFVTMARAIFCGPLDVVGRAGRDIVQHQGLRHAAAQQHNQLFLHFVAALIGTVLRGQVHGITARHPSGDDGYLMHRVLGFAVVSGNGMARLMVCGELFSFSLMTRLFFSVPTTTLMVASSISSMVMALWFFRAARRAASFKRFSRSAPVNPAVDLAMVESTTSGARGFPLACTAGSLPGP